jgi:hypothetical protein
MGRFQDAGPSLTPESFKRWMTDTVFGLTYEQPAAGDLIGARD